MRRRHRATTPGTSRLYDDRALRNTDAVRRSMWVQKVRRPLKSGNFLGKICTALTNQNASTSVYIPEGGAVTSFLPTFVPRSGVPDGLLPPRDGTAGSETGLCKPSPPGSGQMTPDAMRLLIAGTVALTFLSLVGFLVWRLAHTARPARTMFAVAAVLASLPPVLYAFLPRG